MITFGKTLREAREAKGYTISQVAEITHIMSSTIQALENEDFSKIVAPIYGRGFVKLYCSCVGLEPKPLIDEFMAILNGNRPISIRERPVAAEPAIVDAGQVEVQQTSENVIAPASERISERIDEPASERIDEPVSIVKAEPDTTTPNTNGFSLESEEIHYAAEPAQATVEEREEPAQTISRYAAPIADLEPQRRSFASNLPPNFWRLVILALVAVVILILVLLGLRTLYRTTNPSPTPEEAPSVADIGKPAADAAEPTPTDQKKARVPRKLPPLYMN